MDTYYSELEACEAFIFRRLIAKDKKRTTTDGPSPQPDLSRVLREASKRYGQEIVAATVIKAIVQKHH